MEHAHHMNMVSPSREAQVQMLQEDLKRKEEASRLAEEEALNVRKQLSSLLKGSNPSQQSSSPSTTAGPDAPSPEFQLSSVSHNIVPFDQQDACSRRKSIPRSAGHGHHSLPDTPQSALVSSQGIKRNRTMSHQALPSQQMHRTHSSISTQSAGPFVCNGPITPPPKSHSLDQQARNNAMWDSMCRDEAFTDTYTMNRSQSMAARRRTDMVGMPPLAESATNQLLDPAVYFAAQHDDFAETMPPDYLSSPVPTNQMHLGPDISMWAMSNASVCGSMTTALTPETIPMTRENSSVFDSQSVAGALHMVQLGSHQGTDMSQYDSPHYPNIGSGNNSPLGNVTSPSEEDLKGVGSQPFLSPYGHSAAPTDAALMAPDMSRSVSNTSMASNKSLSARLKDTLRRQNQNIKSLQPRPSVDPKSSDSHSNSKKDGKAAITKAKYVRPRQPKVFCNQCSEHPDGFRGEHELRRHRDAKHPEQGIVKKWICVEPLSQGLPVGVAAVNPLDKCKACKAQKRYGAYYNAAAHLRRTHFKEKPSRAKNKHSGGHHSRSDDDKRGGKGGGDWPPMSELKNWMKEIVVTKDQLKAEEDEDNDDESAANTTGGEMDIDLEDDVGGQIANYAMPTSTSSTLGNVHSTISRDSAASERERQSSLFAQLGATLRDQNQQGASENATTETWYSTYANNHMPNVAGVQTFMQPALISSANFTDYNCSPMNTSFPCAFASQMPQYGSVVSSNETVTPTISNLNEAMGHVSDLPYDEIYRQ